MDPIEEAMKMGLHFATKPKVFVFHNEEWDLFEKEGLSCSMV